VSDPRPHLERLLGPEGVGRDPGGLPRALPDSVEGVSDVLRLAAGEGWRVRLEGRGSWLAPDAPADLALSTRALDEVHAIAADGTVTAGAGLSLETLARRSRARGLWLSTDPPGRPDRSLGGAVAVGGGGTLRATFGGIRAMVSRLTLVTPAGDVRELDGDAALAHAGGFGAGGVITEVTLRVRPLPEGDCTLIATAPRDDLTRAAREALTAGARPVALELLSPAVASAPDWVLAARFLGPPPILIAERAHLAQATPLAWTELPADRTPAFWALAARAPLGGPVTLRLGALADGLDEAIDLVGDHLDEGLLSAGLLGGGIRWSGRAEARRLATLRRVAAGREMPLTLERAPWPLREGVGHYGSYREAAAPPPGWREQADPRGRLVVALEGA
jgi:FAD/FMN-containing dehydrogenase